MKKLLLCSVAAGGIMFAAAPASAQLDVTISGHTKNYLGWLDQDEAAATEVREFDMIRESEIHFDVRGVADNGLEYGFHVETEMDDGDDANTVEESYLYLSGAWGRLNLGSEDGANYLLQVAAPSADSNVDGIRQYINPVRYAAAGGGAALTATGAADGFDYDNDFTTQDEKITYLTPVWNGFQAGVSYTPEALDDDGSMNPLVGFNLDDTADNYGAAWDLGARYEGTFNNVGFALGAGYTHVDLETDGGTGLDDFNEWNVGADFDIGAFGVGAIYTENNNGTDAQDEDNTFVLGVDYTTGPFQWGASWYNRDDEGGLAAGSIETDRYSGGVVYTAAPGLTFRGSVNFIQHDVPAAAGTDVDATSVLGGIQFNF